MAVVFYQLLFGLHPYVVTPWEERETNEIAQNISQNLFPFGENRSKIRSFPPPHNKFKALHPVLKQLFQRSFSLHVANRPSAEEWGRATHTIITEYENSEIYRRQEEERLRREAEEQRKQEERRRREAEERRKQEERRRREAEEQRRQEARRRREAEENMAKKRAEKLKQKFKTKATWKAFLICFPATWLCWHNFEGWAFRIGWVIFLTIGYFVSINNMVDEKIKKYKEEHPDDPANKYL